jgi:hypothetical protein
MFDLTNSGPEILPNLSDDDRCIRQNERPDSRRRRHRDYWYWKAVGVGPFDGKHTNPEADNASGFFC